MHGQRICACCNTPIADISRLMAFRHRSTSAGSSSDTSSKCPGSDISPTPRLGHGWNSVVGISWIACLWSISELKLGETPVKYDIQHQAIVLHSDDTGQLIRSAFASSNSSIICADTYTSTCLKSMNTTDLLSRCWGFLERLICHIYISCQQRRRACVTMSCNQII